VRDHVLGSVVGTLTLATGRASSPYRMSAEACNERTVSSMTATNFRAPWLEWCGVPTSSAEPVPHDLISAIESVFPYGRNGVTSKNEYVRLISRYSYVHVHPEAGNNFRAVLGSRVLHVNDETFAVLTVDNLNQRAANIWHWYYLPDGRGSYMLGSFASVAANTGQYSGVQLLAEAAPALDDEARNAVCQLDGISTEYYAADSFSNEVDPQQATATEIRHWEQTRPQFHAHKTASTSPLVTDQESSRRWEFPSTPVFGGLRSCLVVDDVDAPTSAVVAIATRWQGPVMAASLNRQMRFEHERAFCIGAWSSSPDRYWPLQDDRVPILRIPLTQNTAVNLDIVNDTSLWLTKPANTLFQVADLR